MNRRQLLTETLAVPLAAACAADPAPGRRFRFSCQLDVTALPVDANVVSVWLPIPQSNLAQTISDLDLPADAPAKPGRDPREGNASVMIRRERTGGVVRLGYAFTVGRREYRGVRTTLSATERARYLAEEELVPLSGSVRGLSDETTRGLKSPTDRARAIFDRVTTALKYDKTGEGWGRGDAVWACDARRGNCTDFHALLIGMARCAGIPARFAIGFSLPERRGAGEIPGYHCWAEMYVVDRWVPVDSSEAAKALALGDRRRKDYFYGAHDENRVELSRGRHLLLSPRQAGPPLNFFVYPYVEVDGAPHASVVRKFSFEDLG